MGTEAVPTLWTNVRSGAADPARGYDRRPVPASLKLYWAHSFAPSTYPQRCPQSAHVEVAGERIWHLDRHPRRRYRRGLGLPQMVVGTFLHCTLGVPLDCNHDARERAARFPLAACAYPSRSTPCPGEANLVSHTQDPIPSALADYTQRSLLCSRGTLLSPDHALGTETNSVPRVVRHRRRCPAGCTSFQDKRC